MPTDPGRVNLRVYVMPINNKSPTSIDWFVVASALVGGLTMTVMVSWIASTHLWNVITLF